MRNSHSNWSLLSGKSSLERMMSFACALMISKHRLICLIWATRQPERICGLQGLKFSVQTATLPQFSAPSLPAPESTLNVLCVQCIRKTWGPSAVKMFQTRELDRSSCIQPNEQTYPLSTVAPSARCHCLLSQLILFFIENKPPQVCSHGVVGPSRALLYRSGSTRDQQMTFHRSLYSSLRRFACVAFLSNTATVLLTTFVSTSITLIKTSPQLQF